MFHDLQHAVNEELLCLYCTIAHRQYSAEGSLLEGQSGREQGEAAAVIPGSLPLAGPGKGLRCRRSCRYFCRQRHLHRAVRVPKALMVALESAYWQAGASRVAWSGTTFKMPFVVDWNGLWDATCRCMDRLAGCHVC